MGKTTQEQAYYDFMNMNSLLKRAMLLGKPLTYRQIIGFIETKISMFSYEGLEKDLPPRVLRQALTFRNHLCFYKSLTYGIILCQYRPSSERDIYYLPKFVELIALNGQTIKSKVPYKDIVVVRDNNLDLIPMLWLMEYFDKMNNVELTLTKNIDLLKLPAIFTGNEKTVSSFNSLIKKALNFEPFAVTDKTMTDAFNQFDISLPASLEEIMALYKNYKNMALESIGISGTETQKRERLLVSEVESQSEYKNLLYTDFKKCQEDWIKEYNEKFGKNVKLIENYVEYRDAEIDLTAKEVEKVTKAEEKGDNNGNAL